MLSANKAGCSTLQIARNLKRPILSWDTKNRIKRVASQIHFDSHQHSVGLSTDMLLLLLWEVLASPGFVISIVHVALFSPPLPFSHCFLSLLPLIFPPLPSHLSLLCDYVCVCLLSERPLFSVLPIYSPFCSNHCQKYHANTILRVMDPQRHIPVLP